MTNRQSQTYLNRRNVLIVIGVLSLYAIFNFASLSLFWGGGYRVGLFGSWTVDQVVQDILKSDAPAKKCFDIEFTPGPLDITTESEVEYWCLTDVAVQRHDADVCNMIMQKTGQELCRQAVDQDKSL